MKGDSLMNRPLLSIIIISCLLLSGCEENETNNNQDPGFSLKGEPAPAEERRPDVCRSRNVRRSGAIPQRGP